MIKGKEILGEIKKRVYKLKNRLYIEGKYLNEAEFTIGRNIKYEIDTVNKKVTVVLTEKDRSKNKVAQTTQRTGSIVPVIDIKTKEIKQFFETYSNIEVSVYKGKIIFTVKESLQVRVLEFKNSKTIKSFAVSVDTFAKAANCDINVSSLFNITNEDTKKNWEQNTG